MLAFYLGNLKKSDPDCKKKFDDPPGGSHALNTYIFIHVVVIKKAKVYFVVGVSKNYICLIVCMYVYTIIVYVCAGIFRRTKSIWQTITNTHAKCLKVCMCVYVCESISVSMYIKLYKNSVYVYMYICMCNVCAGEC